MKRPALPVRLPILGLVLLALAGCGGSSSNGGAFNTSDPLTMYLLMRLFPPPTAMVVSVASNPVAEDAGTMVGTITLGAALAADLVVNLSSNATGSATVPPTVTVTAGNLTANFTVTLVDDGTFTGNRSVTITATGTGVTTDTVTFLVDDDEPEVPLNITVSFAQNPVAEDIGTVTGTVTFDYAAVADTTVNLTSSNPVAGVPASVSVLNGTSSRTFTITITDDALPNLTRQATIGATATGITGGSSVLLVTDDDYLTGGVGIWDAVSTIPVYVLVGGGGPSTTQTDIYRDHGASSGIGLDPGEIFIMAKTPLFNGTRYELTVIAHTGSGAGTEQFNHTWQFTATNGFGGYGEAGYRTELNAFRAASGAGVGATAIDAEYQVAAVRHAGYQRIQGLMTHGEANSSNPLFTHNNFASRISIANGGSASSSTWGAGINTVSECISSLGDHVDAIDSLWNTVYHRLPMLRHSTEVIGAGNSDNAMVAYPGAGVPVGAMYFTIDFGGDTANAITTAYWPPHNATNFPRIFFTNNEGPDPISSTRTGDQTPVTPDDNDVGGPIHVVLPTTADLSGLTVELTLAP
jgi:uncharacterized protein YkwD